MEISKVPHVSIANKFDNGVYSDIFFYDRINLHFKTIVP